MPFLEFTKEECEELYDHPDMAFFWQNMYRYRDISNKDYIEDIVISQQYSHFLTIHNPMFQWNE